MRHSMQPQVFGILNRAPRMPALTVLSHWPPRGLGGSERVQVRGRPGSPLLARKSLLLHPVTEGTRGVWLHNWPGLELWNGLVITASNSLGRKCPLPKGQVSKFHRFQRALIHEGFPFWVALRRISPAKRWQQSWSTFCRETAAVLCTVFLQTFP